MAVVRMRTSTSPTRSAIPISESSSGRPKRCSSKTWRNSPCTGSGDSSATMRRPAESGCPARMARPEQVDRLRQLLLELPHSPGPLLLHHPVGQQRAHDRHQDGEQEGAGERQGGQAETEADAHGGEDEALDGHRRPGLLERQAEIAQLRHPREDPAQGTALIEAAKQILAGVLLHALAELPELLERPPLASALPPHLEQQRERHRPQRDRQEDQCRRDPGAGGQSGYHFDLPWPCGAGAGALENSTVERSMP